MKKIIYKVPGGKLLRARFETAGDIIKDIRITGDFFIHPEEAIVEIENFLSGKKIDSVADGLKIFLAERNIKIIGFSPEDLSKAMSDPCLLYR